MEHLDENDMFGDSLSSADVTTAYIASAVSLGHEVNTDPPEYKPHKEQGPVAFTANYVQDLLSPDLYVKQKSHGKGCKRPVVLVMQAAQSTGQDPGLLGALLVGIPALVGALASGAPTYIFNRND